MIKDIIIVLEEVLKNAGTILLEMKKKHQLSYHIDGTQVKSKADLAIHEYIVGSLRKIKPDILIVSEENVENIPAHKIIYLDECFLIDPIDGTASLVHGYNGYVIQIAYLKKGKVIFSLIYAPEFDDLYLGIDGEGAYLNGNRIQVKKYFDTIVYIDSYPDPPNPIMEIMRKKKNSKYIECGSIGLKICRIAEGSADFLYKNVLVRDWDLVPPYLILKEAGGLLLSLKGKALRYFEHDNYSHLGFLAVSSSELVKDLEIIRDYIG